MENNTGITLVLDLGEAQKKLGMMQEKLNEIREICAELKKHGVGIDLMEDETCIQE